MTPQGSKGRAVDEIIRFVIETSSIATILVAVGGRGIRAILVGDDASKLLSDLERRIPGARFERGKSSDRALANRIVKFIEAPSDALDLPLDIRGTEFQQRVWKALRAIPRGQTTTFAEVARKVGAPKAVRAVGHACARNALAVAVPCHRVLHSDGSMSGGTTWGDDRQRALLEREGGVKPAKSSASPRRSRR